MNYTIRPYKRSIFIFYFHIYPRRPRNLFQLPKKNSHSMRIRGDYSTSIYNNSLYGLRSPLRTNIILRGHCNYKNNLSHPLHRFSYYYMSMGKFLSISTYTKPFLLLTLSYTPSYCSSCIGASNSPSRNRII